MIKNNNEYLTLTKYVIYKIISNGSNIIFVFDYMDIMGV